MVITSLFPCISCILPHSACAATCASWPDCSLFCVGATIHCFWESGKYFIIPAMCTVFYFTHVLSQKRDNMEACCGKRHSESLKCCVSCHGALIPCSCISYSCVMTVFTLLRKSTTGTMVWALLEFWNFINPLSHQGIAHFWTISLTGERPDRTLCVPVDFKHIHWCYAAHLRRWHLILSTA